MPDGRRRVPYRPRVAARSLTGAAVAALCLLTAACGGAGSGTGVAQLETTAAATTTAAPTTTSPAAQEQAMLAFSTCMRTHGVADFPDPTRNADGTYGFTNLNALRKLVRGDQGAFTACQPLLAKTGILTPQKLADFQQQMVGFAKCMRGHGIPDFPDPNANGRFAGKLKALDPTSPPFQKALTACRPELSAAIDVFAVGGTNG